MKERRTRLPWLVPALALILLCDAAGFGDELKPGEEGGFSYYPGGTALALPGDRNYVSQPTPDSGVAPSFVGRREVRHVEQVEQLLRGWYLELGAGAILTRRAAPGYFPSVTLGHVPSRLEATFARLFGRERSWQAGARWYVTGRLTELSRPVRGAFEELQRAEPAPPGAAAAPPAAAALRPEAPAVPASTALFLRTAAYTRRVDNWDERYDALLGRFHYYLFADHAEVTSARLRGLEGASLTTAGVGFSQRLADSPTGSLFIAGAAAAAWLQDVEGFDDRSAIRPRVALFWQDGGARSRRPWRIRVGVELRLKSALDARTGVAGFVRAVDHRSHLEWTVAGGRGTGGSEFVTLRISRLFDLSRGRTVRLQPDPPHPPG